MTILSLETKHDIRRLHDIWLARLAYEFRCEQSDILAAIEPVRADAPVPQTAPAPEPMPVAEHGSVESLAPDLNARHEADIAGESPTAFPASHSPETADELPKDAGETIPSDHPGARAEALPVISGKPEPNPIPENAPAQAQAGEAANTPAPNPVQAAVSPPAVAPDASDLPSDEAGEAPPPMQASPAPIPRTTLFDRVSEAHAEHPDWTARQIAAYIVRPVSSVQTTLSAVRSAAKEFAKSSEPEPQQEPPEEAPAEPADGVLTPAGWVDASEPSGAAAEHRVASHSTYSMPARHSQGQAERSKASATKFVRLKESVSGRFLGSSIVDADGELVLLERNRETMPYLWRGTRDQLKAVRKKHPETHALHVVAIESAAKADGVR